MINEFLTIRNFVPEDPPTIAIKICLGCLLFLIVCILIFWIASFVEYLNGTVFRVREWELDMIDEEVRNGGKD